MSVLPATQPVLSEPEPAAAGHEPDHRRRLPPIFHHPGHLARYAFLLILALVIVYPLLWIALAGFKTNNAFLQHPFSLPTSFSFSNYRTVLVSDGFYKNLLNSLWISAVTTVIVVALSTGLAYAIARLEWRLQRIALVYVLTGLLMPVYAALIPLYIYLHHVEGLLGPRLTLVIPYIALGLPVSVLILVGYFRQLPNELEEAAVLDGCSTLQLLVRVVMPVSLPAIAVAATFTFLACWNELLFALVFLNFPNDQTAPVSLLRFTGTFGNNWVFELAGITLAVIPTLVIYLGLQRYIMEGVLRGSSVG
jgi:raffinose/stachyose/melibiose transport system permease protein